MIQERFHPEPLFYNCSRMAKKNPMHAVKRKPAKKASTRRKKSTIKSTKQKKWGLAFVALLIAVGGITYYLIKDIRPMTTASFRNTVPEGFPSIGIDVSHHQGEIDWHKLMTESGFDSLIHFVYCKATEGNTHFDRQWVKNRKTLNDMGIPNGAYHFFIPQDSALPQAKHFLNTWQKRDIDLPPVLDIETEGLSDTDMIAKMKIWLNEVEKKSGMRPIIYTSRHFYETKFQNDFKNYRFWIAAYSGKPLCIDDERIIHWQYSETGKLPGIKEKIDLNVSKLKF